MDHCANRGSAAGAPHRALTTPLRPKTVIHPHPLRKLWFAADSLLEEDGFEPPVPPGSNTSVSTGFASRRGGRSLFRKGPVLGGDRKFESAFLCRRVRLREFRDRGGRDPRAAGVLGLSVPGAFADPSQRRACAPADEPRARLHRRASDRRTW